MGILDRYKYPKIRFSEDKGPVLKAKNKSFSETLPGPKVNYEYSDIGPIPKVKNKGELCIS